MCSAAGEVLRYLPLKNVKITDSFWGRYLNLVTEEILPYQLDTLCDRIPDAPPSRCIRNLRIAAKLEQGEFEGFVFQDTDLAKWLEAVAYSLAYRPNPELEQTADEMIALVGQAQEENGYLNSYFSIRYPGHQFCNLKEGHELYTAGHFIEAAVAYYQVTGKDAFLNMMCRFADLICQVFRTEEYRDGVPGHEEIELALFRLAEVTGKDDYRAMAYEFINRRGCSDYLANEKYLPRFIDVWHDRNPFRGEYSQSHAPVRMQKTVEGHAVRALYLLSAMADLAGSYQDAELLAACERLYGNLTQRRMYITGSVGSSGVLERFTTDFDLPNDTNYSESCASVALAMFCKRMARITGEAKYMDTAELALYNTVLASVAMDGKSFFYVNPLEVVPAACMSGTDKDHVKPVRQKWFGCACCPPNIARTLASIGEYLLFQGENSLWVNLFVSTVCEAQLGGAPVRVTMESGMPDKGQVTIRLEAEMELRGHLRVRVPGYAETPEFFVNGSAVEPEIAAGYAVIPASGRQLAVEFRFAMPPRRFYADPRVSADTGKCAVKKGPLVYCLEQQDNGANLAGLRFDESLPLEERFDETLFGGTTVVEADGWRLKWEGGLYGLQPPTREPVRLRFVPYAFWGNREPGEMAVWVRT